MKKKKFKEEGEVQREDQREVQEENSSNDYNPPKINCKNDCKKKTQSKNCCTI